MDKRHGCGQEPRVYDWYCQRRRWHLGPHRYNNYTWNHGAKHRASLRLIYLRLRFWLTRQPPWRKPYAKTRTTYAPVEIGSEWWGERITRG